MFMTHFVKFGITNLILNEQNFDMLNSGISFLA